MARFDKTGSVAGWTGQLYAAPLTEPASAEIVTDVEGIRALTAEYARLYSVTGNTLPFATQEWHLAWCRHLLARTRRALQEPRFCVLRKPDRTCVAIVPLILTRRRLGPLKIGVVGLVGADPALTGIRNPLVEPGYERATVRAVHESLASMSGWDWIQWSGVSPALGAALDVEAAPQWYQVVDDYLLDLPRDWAQFRSSLPRNLRESLRHCYNSLRRAGLAFELVVACGRDEVRNALHRFLELHALRANMPWGPRHEDRFAARSLRAFLYEVCDLLAARDAVRVFQLRIGEEIVAARIAFVIGGSMYLYYSGFDPAWARYSVMTTTVAEALRYAIASGVDNVNLSVTGDLAKLRWRPRRVDFYSALVHRDSIRSRLACGAYRVAVSGRSAPRRLLRRLLQARARWN